MRRQRIDLLGWSALVLGGLTVVGWGVDTLLLAAAGLVGVAVAGLIFVWQRHCLTGVGYRRALGRERAMFGEEVSLEVQMVNDKLLPLTWLHVEDRVPHLTIRGGDVNEWGAFPVVNHLLPMLPYQEVDRRMTVVCDRRGLHTFGPALLHSGDPVGYRERMRRLEESHQLLVYPKVYGLAPYGVASRVPLGATRAARLLVEDHSRRVGVREYRSGDPLRLVDWRATARSRTMLVRVFEPSVSLRVAIFLDTKVPQLAWLTYDVPELEFTIAVAASVAADLAGRRVGIGLFSTGTVDGQPIAREPSTSPDALPQVLELLARASPFGPFSLGEVLNAEAPRLPYGTSVVVVAADFPESTLLAVSELRRRGVSVTAVGVITEDGTPPPADWFEQRLLARFSDDWDTRTSLELAS